LAAFFLADFRVGFFLAVIALRGDLRTTFFAARFNVFFLEAAFLATDFLPRFLAALLRPAAFFAM
jgi:hypothetical protein